jgi:hypothetical protein
MSKSKSIVTIDIVRRITSNTNIATLGKYHVIYSGHQKWSLVKDGSVRAIRNFSTVREATNFVRTRRGTVHEIVIHKSDGSINRRITI